MERLGRRLRGHKETIGRRIERDLEAQLPLPATPCDASDKHVSGVSSLSRICSVLMRHCHGLAVCWGNPLIVRPGTWVTVRPGT